MAYTGSGLANWIRFDLTAEWTQGATTVALPTGLGASMPELTTAHPEFYLLVWDYASDRDPVDSSNREVLKVTGRTDDSLTVVRGQRGTSDVTHAVGERVALTVMAEDIDAWLAALNNHLSADDHAGIYEPVISAGTSADYWRGDKTWQALDRTAVGLGNVDNVQQMPASYLDTDGTLAANSDVKVPSQKAVKTYAAAADHTHAQLHDRAHDATSASDHTSTGAAGYYLRTLSYVDSYVKSQLSFDGADGSTTITEDVTSGPTWSVAGGAHIEQDQSKFGGTSLALDGTGDWISTTNATLNTTLGSQNFTIEFWVKLSANGTQQVFCGQGGGVGNWNDSGGGHGWIFFKGSDNKFYFQYHTSGVGGVGTVVSAATHTIAGAWTHLAVVQNGGTVTIYKNGTSVASGSVASVNYSTGGTQGFYIGTDAAGDTPVNGYMDEFRFSVGVARWTTNFTPETSAYASGNYLTWGNALTNPMTTLGDMVYGAASGVPTRLAGSAGWLKSTGTAAPAWTAIAQADVSGLGTSDSVLHASLKIGNADTLLQRDKANSASMASGDQFWTEGLVAKHAGDLICYLLDTYGLNIVGLWLGNETGATTTLTDRSLAAHNGTLSANASTLTPDVDNLTRHLTLGTATLTIADHADFSPGNGTTDTAFSVFALVYPTGLAANQNILSKWKLTTGATAREWRVLVNTSGSLYMECYDESAGAYIGRTKASIVGASAWQTIIATYSGSAASSGIKLYRNGVQVDDTNSANGSYTAMEDTAAVVGMHRIATSGAAEEKFSGKLAASGYIKAEMTAAQVRALDARLRGGVGITP